MEYEATTLQSYERTEWTEDTDEQIHIIYRLQEGAKKQL